MLGHRLIYLLDHYYHGSGVAPFQFHKCQPLVLYSTCQGYLHKEKIWMYNQVECRSLYWCMPYTKRNFRITSMLNDTIDCHNFCGTVTFFIRSTKCIMFLGMYPFSVPVWQWSYHKIPNTTSWIVMNQCKRQVAPKERSQTIFTYRPSLDFVG